MQQGRGKSMIRLSKLADYGIVLLTYFGRGPEDETVYTARELADESRLPLPTVSKIVSDAVGAGKVKIVAAIYDLETGVVTYLD